MQISRIESLTRKYFDTLLGGYRIYNYRPNWLKWTTGNNLELDIFYPDFNFAVEVNGLQHRLLKENRARDEFKRQKCAERGIYLFEVRYAQNLLKQAVVDKLKEETGIDFWIDRLPFGLRSQLKYYKPKKLKFMKAVRFKASLERYADKQAEEVEFNRRKIERQAR